jgi:excisionase family DNA binding protein
MPTESTPQHWQADRILYSVDDACAELSISRPTIYRLAKSGALKLVKIGSASRITAASMKAYVDQLESIA